MKKVLEYPDKYSSIIICSGCGCKFCFEIEDIVSEVATNAAYDRLVCCYVECPLCHVRNKLPFSRK